MHCFILSDGVDEYAVNKFLSDVFPSDQKSSGQICSLIKESASRRFDMKEEVFHSIYCTFNLMNFLKMID